VTPEVPVSTLLIVLLVALFVGGGFMVGLTVWLLWGGDNGDKDLAAALLALFMLDQW
jgi:hypothetical protein